VKVLLAGEGKTDLGDYAEPHFRKESPKHGVVVALAETFAPAEWTVGHVVTWSKIKKYRAGDHASPEARHVLALALDAKERALDAVVFSRDGDGESERMEDVRDGIKRARREFPNVPVAGGGPTQTIENWLLAIRGESGTEDLHRAKAKARVEAEARDFEAKVDWVRASGSMNVASDAASLHDWIRALRELVARSVHTT